MSWWTSKTLDVEARRKWLKRSFDRSLPIFFICTGINAAGWYAGLISSTALLGCYALGLLQIKALLQQMVDPFPEVRSWAECRKLDASILWKHGGIMNLFVTWGMLFLNDHLGAKGAHLWLSALCFLLEMICVWAATNLLLWYFREPFWQYATGEKWPRPLTATSRPATPITVEERSGVPITEAPLAPYNY